jgi:hypothetical protein
MRFVNAKEIETIYDAGGKHRVTIFSREDGTYGLYFEEYSDDPYEECFVPTIQSASFIDTLETARREAQGRLVLLK